MAVGLPDPPQAPYRKPADWTEIFRGFQVALDPRKLLVAAAGVLAMSLGWYLLSLIFEERKPDQKDVKYQTLEVSKQFDGKKKADGTDYTEQDFVLEADKQYKRDLTEWQVNYDLAGPGGRLRTMPWKEYRGPNPVLLLERFAGGTAVDLTEGFKLLIDGTIPVLVEPFAKLLLPAVKLLDPNASFVTRVYLLLCLVWTVVVWAFCGGVISRIAAVQLGGKERITLPQAVRFVTSRYVNYVLSPLVPVGIIAFIILAMAVYGFVAMIPFVGDIILYGLLLPLVLLGGVVMAILLVGLAGYPLMYPTVSAEGSDTFDALSRSYNYVFQAPWSYLWYNLVSILYGSLAVLFVVFMGSLTVYLGKFAVSQAPWSETWNRKPDYLFADAPESFGWRQLLVAGSPLTTTEKVVPDPETGRRRYVYTEVDPTLAKQYRDNMWTVEKVGAAMASFWLVLVLLLVIGFSYSYFWSAATIIYLLMRRKVDETDLDEIYEDEPLPELPPAGPVAPPAAPNVGVSSLPVVPPTPVPPPYTPPVAPPQVTPAPLPVPPPYTPPAPMDLPAVDTSESESVSPPVPPVTTPTTEPALFPPPTDDLEKADEFKKDNDSL